MRIKITHTTRYHFSAPVSYGLQQLRLTPQDSPQQRVHTWKIVVEGGRQEVSYLDHHHNRVVLVSMTAGAESLMIRCEGDVETTDTQGLVVRHRDATPLWLYQRQTALTKVGQGTKGLMASLERADPLRRLHMLSAKILEKVVYQTGISRPHWTAEDAIAEGRGVCQDHSHIFIAGARLMGLPARYVSGYLVLDHQDKQEAAHAWAEAFVEDLGWVGFDVSNGISPDARYVALARGMDYHDAAPITGIRRGGSAEALSVSLMVSQQ
jgi:transglutaminase-like putative cysteine protease